MIGIGANVFEGLVRVGRDNGSSGNGRDSQPDSTAFWTLFNTQGKAAGLSIEVAKGLVSKGNWDAAFKELTALISGSKVQ